MFLFIASFTIIRLLVKSLTLTRQALSIFSTILILILSDFNITNIISAFAIFLSSTPDIITSYLNNITSFFSSFWGSTSTLPSKIDSTANTKQIIKEAIESKVTDHETFQSLRKQWDFRGIPEYEEETSSNYKYYLLVGLVAATITVTYIYSSEISAYFIDFIKSIGGTDGDKPSGSGSSPDSISGLGLGPNGETVLSVQGEIKLLRVGGEEVFFTEGKYYTPNEWLAELDKRTANFEALANPASTSNASPSFFRSRSLIRK